MDEDTKQLIKWGAIGLAGYFVYQWLQNSGLWAQWFGTSTASNSFNTSTALLAYCQANPNGTAIYVDPTTGASSTATCAQWIASNSNATLPVTSAVSGLAPNYQQAISLMQQAAGNDSQTVNNWSYYWQNGTMFDGGPPGFGVQGSISPAQFNQILGLNANDDTDTVTSEQFVAWLVQTSSDPSSAGVATPAGVMVTGGTGGGMQGYDFNSDYSGWVN
jgi:hypothetical protein